MNTDGNVDVDDLVMFSNYWLWSASSNEPNEPGEPNYPADSNVVYSILDANCFDEITLDVNETVTLYVDLDTTEYNNMRIFDIEITISDPNLGSIDNTEYDPNDPNSCTTQILADPRMSGFDYWGSGVTQRAGIEFIAANIGDQMDDGHLVSFEYTCKGSGEVTLELTNYLSANTGGEKVYPVLESITINQPDP